jgi:nitronate monooxygenase
MRWKTTITEMIGCKYPIILGAFGGYDNKELTAAISEAGGCGILTAKVYENENELRDAIQYVKKQTTNPFGINFSVSRKKNMEPLFIRYLDIAEEEGVNTIITAAYRVKNLGKQIKDKGINWIHKATTMKHAISGEKMGADAVILTGLEGGGLKNPNQNTLFINLVNANRLLKVPFIASGGISDGKGMVASLILGAQAVHICTAFLPTIESPIPDDWKQKIIHTDCNDPAFIEQVLHFDSDKPQYTDMSMAIGTIDKIMSVKDVIKNMIEEAEIILKKLKSYKDLIDFSL